MEPPFVATIYPAIPPHFIGTHPTWWMNSTDIWYHLRTTDITYLSDEPPKLPNTYSQCFWALNPQKRFVYPAKNLSLSPSITLRRSEGLAQAQGELQIYPPIFEVNIGILTTQVRFLCHVFLGSMGYTFLSWAWQARVKKTMKITKKQRGKCVHRFPQN